MNDNELSLSFGYNRNWLAVIKKNNIDKYNWLIKFNKDKYISIQIAKAIIVDIINRTETFILLDNYSNSDLCKLKLFNSQKNNHTEILKDNLYKLRDRPLSIKWSFIQKLIIIDRELLQ